VDASLVVIGSESIQLAMEVDAVPEEGSVEILAPKVPIRRSTNG
jgi:hypothetical protein